MLSHNFLQRVKKILIKKSSLRLPCLGLNHIINSIHVISCQRDLNSEKTIPLLSFFLLEQIPVCRPEKKIGGKSQKLSLFE